MFDVVLNMNRLQKLVAAFDENAAAMVGKHLGTDDKAVSALRLSVEGGAALKVTAVMNVRYLPKFFLVADAAGPPAPAPRVTHS
jgi:hypothetical protein